MNNTSVNVRDKLSKDIKWITLNNQIEIEDMPIHVDNKTILIET
jgi:hypothetical protein